MRLVEQQITYDVVDVKVADVVVHLIEQLVALGDAGGEVAALGKNLSVQSLQQHPAINTFPAIQADTHLWEHAVTLVEVHADALSVQGEATGTNVVTPATITNRSTCLLKTK